MIKNVHQNLYLPLAGLFLILLLTATVLYLLNRPANSLSITDRDELINYIHANIGGEQLLHLPPRKIAHHVSVLGYQDYLEIIEEVDPMLCHDAAHIVGELAFFESGSIPEGLALCSEKCMSGCIHGVLLACVGGHSDMSHSTSEHIAIEDFVDSLETICMTESLDNSLEGTCIHGVGHALMSLAPSAADGLKYCDRYQDEKKRYYCYNGAYMELLHNRSVPKLPHNSLEPCTREAGAVYPIACMRYLTWFLTYDMGEEEARDFCLNIEDQVLQTGCFHGLGRVHADNIIAGESSLEICLSENKDATLTCIESVTEMFKDIGIKDSSTYCSPLSSNPELERFCQQSAATGLYSFHKDFSPYLQQ